MVVAGEDSPSLLAKLTAAQRREREAERRAETADAELARAAKAAAAPSSEARRLRAALEASQAEADVLRSRLGARERQLSPTRMPVGRQMGSGLAADLEDVDGDRAQQLEVQMAALQEELAAADAARSQLAARCTQLEQQLQQLRQQGGGGSAPAAQQAAEAEVWQQEVARLQGEKAVLKEECRRLRQEAAQSSAEIEHLTQRLQQLAGGSSSHQTASPSKAHRAQEQHARQQAEQQQEVGASGIGSPIKEPAGASTAAAVGARDSPPPAAVQRPSSRPCSAPSAQGQRPGSALGRSAPALPARHVAASPSEADKRQFRREMQHTLHTAERPGVVSRFPHSLGSFLAIRGDLKVGVCMNRRALVLDWSGATAAGRQLLPTPRFDYLALCRASWKLSWQLSWPATAWTPLLTGSPMLSALAPWLSWSGGGQVGLHGGRVPCRAGPFASIAQPGRVPFELPTHP